MRSEGVDALITPVHALPAYKHGFSKNLTSACSYSMLFNLLNFPAGNYLCLFLGYGRALCVTYKSLSFLCCDLKKNY